MTEIIPPSDISLIPPEDLRMDKEDVFGDAQKLAESAVKGIPFGCTPAQERVLMDNAEKVYRMSADILFTTLDSKKGVMH